MQQRDQSGVDGPLVFPEEGQFLLIQAEPAPYALDTLHSQLEVRNCRLCIPQTAIGLPSPRPDAPQEFKLVGLPAADPVVT